MSKKEVSIGDVVQLSPEVENSFFRGCFMTVTEVKSWGVQGYICVPANSRDEMPGHAYYRAAWEKFLTVGTARWAAINDEAPVND